MICPDEIDFLHYLARTQYRNRGSIIEFGPLGGVSTCALALGAPEAILHAYDFWIYHDSLRDYFPGRYLRLGQSVLPAFLENIRPFRDRVRVHRGDLTRQRWASGPIEIVFVDAAKTPASLLHMFREFFPWVVPQGWIVWQDYVSATCPWIHLALEELADYFEYWDSPEGGTVVTRLKCPLPREPLPADYFGTLRLERARAHLARARDRFPGWETLDIWLAEALWLALAGCAAESRNILQAIPQDSRFSQGSFDYDLKFIAHWIDLLEDARDRVMQEHGPDAHEMLEYEAVKLSIANLRTFPCIPEREAAGKLTIHGAHFAIADGLLRILDEKSGEFRVVS